MIGAAAVAAVPVAVNIWGDPVDSDTLVGVTVREFVPVVVPKTQLPTIAIPLAFVVAGEPVTEPLPLAGVNVILTPLTGLPFASFTMTLGAMATAVPTVANWESPPIFAIRVAGPAIVVKEALVPATESVSVAVTV